MIHAIVRADTPFFDTEAFGAIVSALIAGFFTFLVSVYQRRRQDSATQFDAITDHQAQSVTNPMTGQIVDVSGTNQKMLEMFFDVYQKTVAQDAKIDSHEQKIDELSERIDALKSENDSWHTFYEDLTLRWSEHRIKDDPPPAPKESNR